MTLKVSHNLYASTLPLLVAVKNGKRTLAEGMQIEGDVLAKLGLDVKEIAPESGAGGGNADRVSPRTTVKLLQEMAKRPDWPIFKAALPVLGVDGTLADAVAREQSGAGQGLRQDRNLRRRGFAQSALASAAKSLAGGMTTASGRTLVLTIFVNDVTLPRGVTSVREGKRIGHLCEIIYENAK